MSVRTFVRAAALAATMSGLALAATANPASAGSEIYCDGGSSCVSAQTLASNSNHQVCFGGTLNTWSLSFGTVELWDLDTATKVGTQNIYSQAYKSSCVGGLYGRNYYVVGRGTNVRAEAWN
ncbi:hypothetical protein Lfu02_69200 [Longispora fulva]|uniref:Peptidase inhibitor family I36 n=1 Tax=Longispora fulva TaxID=619741 RepID=A0A8J7KDM5_9ACTN|nr:hypothetical protein [Longispora fulva]MBG6134175.1 hypothetical protein [Longispora fulva]GIG62548.1 hypothetical protein Lfu02_69200 [Longispora fulva]